MLDIATKYFTAKRKNILMFILVLGLIVEASQAKKYLPDDSPQNNVIVFGANSSVAGTFIGSQGFGLRATWPAVELRSTPILNRNSEGYYVEIEFKHLAI